MLTATRLTARLAPTALACLAACTAAAGAVPYFGIRVIDGDTGRGVPLVELETVNAIRCYTDSAGWAAFHEPGLMNRRVFFFVKSHGYEFPKDGFGMRGVALETREGGRAELKIKRINIAERLYRITGAGIYADSVLLGHKPPTRQPVLNAEVLGQDSVQSMLYRGRIFWFWGDTARARYPLGHFRMSGATSELPAQGGLDPAVGVDLTYFAGDEGFSRPMMPMPEATEGMLWLSGFVTVPDGARGQRLAARYARMKSLGEMLEHGLAVFNDEKLIFQKAAEFDLKEPWRFPEGHPIPMKDGPADFYLFPRPFPVVRAPADLARLKDPAAYVAFTCLAPASRYDKSAAQVDRGPDGRAVWAWKPDTDPVGQQQERELIKAGKLRPDDARFQLIDADTGKPVVLHGGSFCWNAYRKKWILIGVEIGGTSFLGEVWFAQADSPLGPWRKARKVVTHDQYTFYNPKHHPFFDQDGGRIIYFEGTYANTFSGNPVRTPRYDYNQVMYRLDLSDPRLADLP
ncbi:MAG: hypothetical protein FJ288_07845 [Planctomycetes bacterium]|nr:hypothetical protein [Planctomycetota bacterium]